jgi:2-keto-4-pentenoate hydratase
MTPHNVKLAASQFLEARRSRRWLTVLPKACRPSDVGEAYAIQRLVFAALGRPAAWKVGAGSPDASPAYAEIADSTLFRDGETMPSGMFNLIGAEAEVAYRLGRDLPPRPEDYSVEEVKAAVDSVLPAIEISDTRFAVWASQNRPSHIADQLNHGALAVGTTFAGLPDVDPLRQKAVMEVNGEIRAETIGGNPAGDPMRLLVWLANVGTREAGGLRAGSVITTGSLTGVIFVAAPSSRGSSRAWCRARLDRVIGVERR